MKMKNLIIFLSTEGNGQQEQLPRWNDFMFKHQILKGE